MREKLIELLEKLEKEGALVTMGNGYVANLMIANGVTLATDNNVAAKTECEYCQQFDDPCGVPMIAAEDSDPDRGIYLYNGFLCASGGEFCEAKVNFCPMCGRKLAEPPKGE
jgi:hypothetical protein